MENKKLYYILVASAFTLVFLSYLTGFIVGKHAGFVKAKAQFDVEKQNLMRTFAAMKPVSRPVKERKTIIVDKTASENASKTANGAKTVAGAENKTITRKVVKVAKEKPRETAQNPKVKKLSKGSYFLQLGVFRNKLNAVRLAKRVKALGLNVKTVLEGNRVRVIVGYLTKDKALSEYKLLKEKGITAIIRRRN